VEAFVYAKLTSKKFRKWAMDESSEQQVKKALQLNISQNKPIQFRYPFGGYKLWRLPTAPEVDWAEFLAIVHYCKYLASIAAAYEPGVELLFASDDMIIERMDNVPVADTDAYFASFKKLLEQFRPHFPANMKIDIVRIGDLYEDKTAMEKELAENVERMKEQYKDVDESKKQKKLVTSELNVCWDGAKDLTGLSDEEKRAIIEMGPIYHDAYCALSKRRAFNRGEDKIVIFTTPVPNAIAIGTTKASMTKFWTGIGVLEHSGDSYKAVILSPKNIEEKLNGIEPVDVSSIIPLRNFSLIHVV
jgi:hypothetical protein